MNMPKHYKDMMDEIINKIDEDDKKEVKKEDAPANAVAHGGVDMNPTGKKRVMGTLKRKVQESDDNNNVVLKGVYKVLNKLEEKIDEISGVVKEEIKIETPKRKKTIKEKARV